MRETRTGTSSRSPGTPSDVSFPAAARPALETRAALSDRPHPRPGASVVGGRIAGGEGFLTPFVGEFVGVLVIHA